MDSLRLILLLCGVALIGGIYVFEMWRRGRLRSPRRRVERDPDVGGLDGLDSGEAEPDWLGRLDEFDAGQAEAVVADGGDPGVSPPATPQPPAPSTTAKPDAAPRRVSRPRAEGAATPPEELVVAFTVMARDGARVDGQTLFESLQAVGMEHGDMDIFHHPGVGPHVGARSVFSAANVVEPGTFEPGAMEGVETPGVVLFLRLPGPVDATVAFELMLNTGQRLAELIGGELRDQSRCTLTPQAIAHQRERIVEFNRRQRLAGA